MNWLELAVVGVVGAIAGWAAHWFVARTWPRLSTVHARNAIRLSDRTTASEPEGDPFRSEEEAARPNVPANLSEGAGAAGRVILHLYGLGRLSDDEIGAIGFTQRGMGRTLTLRQGTLAKVLSRLRAAGVLEVDRRHVAGEPRRMNVYRLTSLGESVARDLKHQRPPRNGLERPSVTAPK